MKNEIITEKHDTKENALIVENYPYGWKRTQKKYWIESRAKNGDRLMTQTLNPKTQEWNNIKKSTYYDLMVLTRNPENQHIGFNCVELYNNTNNYKALKEDLKDYPFNEIQKTNINRGKAHNKAMEGVSFSFEPTQYKHKETGEIKTSLNIMELGNYERVRNEKREKEQEQIKNYIAHKTNKEFNKLESKEVF